MPQYTVKSGDTLSGISQKLGLPSYSSLSGYRSGDPNLIYPGEVLSYGGSTKAAAAKPKAKPKAAAAPKPDPYQQRVSKYQGQLDTFDQSYENPIDVYNRLTESLGLSDVRTRVTDLRGAMMDTENMIRNVEGSVAGRTQDSFVTEAQKQRLVGMEQEPLADLYRTQGQQYELAQGDYAMLQGEAQFQTGLTMEGIESKYDRILDQLQIAIDRADTNEEKKRWQKEYKLKQQQFSEEKRQFSEKMAEDRRQFNVSESNKNARSNRSSSSSKVDYTPAVTSMNTQFRTVAGSDGYVSPSSYQKARSAWNAQGYDPDKFDNYFSGFANPSHIDDYLR